MNTKGLLSACCAFVVVAGFGSAGFADTEGPEEPPVDCVSDCEPTEPEKGNNGWGNGEDPTNPGSNSGPPSQVETKNNREIWDKFIGRHYGR